MDSSVHLAANDPSSRTSRRCGHSCFPDDLALPGIEKVGMLQMNGSAESVFIREGFRWDDCDAYLFDIDGTLLHAHGGVHTDAFSWSVEAVMGYPLSMDGVAVHGSTDTAIFRDAFRLAAIDDEVWQPRLEEILERLRSRVWEQRERMSVTVMPGVLSMLAHLKNRGKLLGVATGDLEQIGWLKIELAGLRDWFTFGGFSDRFIVRSEMIAHAAALARAIVGADASVCVVGDTPFDISAAKANELPVIAVATGRYSFDELMQCTPDVCATTLEALLDETRRSA